jgi:hypothetical protein
MHQQLRKKTIPHHATVEKNAEIGDNAASAALLIGFSHLKSRWCCSLNAGKNLPSVFSLTDIKIDVIMFDCLVI